MTTENAKKEMRKGAINLDLSISQLYHGKAIFGVILWLHYVAFVIKLNIFIK
jgi:hypothetical protein